MIKKAEAKQHPAESRRDTILQAALDCFLKHGYAKTSLDDIAKTARLSRPLIYLVFKNKEDIFRATYDYVLTGAFEHADKAASARASKAERLMGVMDALLLTPWQKVSGHPMSSEFYDECSTLNPEVTQRHERAVMKHATSILGDKDLAEVFALATIGIQEDLPSHKVLMARLEILIERFSR